MSVLYIRDKVAGEFIPIKTIKGEKGDTGAIDGLDFYDQDPKGLGTASPGTSSLAARGDHIHPMPSASDVGARALNAAIAHEYTVTLTASGWTGDAAPYTQTANVSGILAADSPIADLDVSSASADDYSSLSSAWACVGRIQTADGQITATCYGAVPTVDMTVRLMAVR